MGCLYVQTNHLEGVFSVRIIDISRPLQTAPKYPTAPDTTFGQVDRIEAGCDSNFSLIFTNTHAGTHVDAGKHFVHGELSIGQMPLDVYMGKCRVITVPEHSLVEKSAFEGKLEGAERLVMHGGGFSYLTPEAAQYIVDSGIICLVTDGWSPAPLNNEKQIHQMLLKAHVGIVENVTLDHVQDGDYTLLALPVNFGDSDGAPCRAVLIAD